MIQVETYFVVADNSGAKLAQCIRVLGGYHRKFGTVGDLVVVAIKSCIPGKRVRKGEVKLAVVIRTKKAPLRRTGAYASFTDNAVVLLNEQHAPIGTRVLGPVAKELRVKSYGAKILSLASVVV